jgi:hypothetical protein
VDAARRKVSKASLNGIDLNPQLRVICSCTSASRMQGLQMLAPHLVAPGIRAPQM